MTEFDQKRFIAAKFLRDNLAGGPLDAKIVQERAKANGISEPTLRRARRPRPASFLAESPMTAKLDGNGYCKTLNRRLKQCKVIRPKVLTRKLV